LRKAKGSCFSCLSALGLALPQLLVVGAVEDIYPSQAGVVEEGTIDSRRGCLEGTGGGGSVDIYLCRMLMSSKPK